MHYEPLQSPSRNEVLALDSSFYIVCISCRALVLLCGCIFLVDVVCAFSFNIREFKLSETRTCAASNADNVRCVKKVISNLQQVSSYIQQVLFTSIGGHLFFILVCLYSI